MNVLQRARAELAITQLAYDYDRIPDQDRDAVQDAAREIKPQLSTMVDSIIVVGKRLTEIKGRVPYGQWGEWLDTEFHLSERMAQHWMNVAEKFQDRSEKFSELPVSTLYLLAAPSTPAEAVQEVEEKIDAGERVTVAQAKAIIELKKPQAKEEQLTSEQAARLAYEWLRNYEDDGGRRWGDLTNNQIHHANSPCYQAFVRAFPKIKDHKFALKQALAHLRRDEAFEPKEEDDPPQTNARAFYYPTQLPEDDEPVFGAKENGTYLQRLMHIDNELLELLRELVDNKTYEFVRHNLRTARQSLQSAVYLAGRIERFPNATH